jgi:hypothetical protein
MYPFGGADRAVSGKLQKGMRIGYNYSNINRVGSRKTLGKDLGGVPPPGGGRVGVGASNLGPIPPPSDPLPPAAGELKKEFL